ncbi:hypothetical protein VKS41_005085 [Umbelopsis sp. WA50703]
MDSRVRNYAGDHNITIMSEQGSDTSDGYYLPQNARQYATANDTYDSFRQRRRDVGKGNGRFKPFGDQMGYADDYENSYMKAARKRTALEEQTRKRDLKISLVLTIWAMYIRLWKIWQPSSVVFDEVHFGGFASKYIKTRFFMDVHPPLAKMLIALAAKLAGFDGGFDFKDIGKDYIEPGVPYVSIRVFCAMTGLLVVPIAYMTIRGAGHSVAAGLLAAFFICYENGLVANNRLILLDPPLLFFTSLTILMWINFHNQKNHPFNFWWWTWLALTGAGLGLTASCKWVGLFTIATVGFSTIKDLLEIWSNVRVSIHDFGRHFAARAACLIVLPIVIYMIMFQIHFISLPNSGEGDGFMSPEFQQSLSGHAMADSPIDIAYGSKVYIRHIETHGGYLHSHPHNYPTGSKQQQITLYPHKDDNNWWRITKQYSNATSEIEWVNHGDIIRLEHVSTNKRLHAHDLRPPMTDVEYHNEVSAYGTGTLEFTGDSNDFWRVEILDHDKRDPEAKERLRTLHSKFQLVHINDKCALFSHSVKLPEWGWGQQEVTCIKNGKKPRTMWYIESTENENLPADAELVNYRRPGFLSKFIELNQVMWNTNKGLTDSHPYDSRPNHWPWLRRGINFWGGGDLHRHIYLLGNPLVYWSSTAAIVLYLVSKVATLLLEKRGYNIEMGGLRKFYDESAGFFFMGWLLHYTPFFLMGRQLFLHHYMPALYFAVLALAVTFDLATIRMPNRRRIQTAAFAILIIILVYRRFIPITYGEPWTQASCEKAKWLKTWDFDCNQFYTDYSQYNQPPAMGEKIQNVVKDFWYKNKQDPNREMAPEEADDINIATDAADVAEQDRGQESPAEENDNVPSNVADIAQNAGNQEHQID